MPITKLEHEQRIANQRIYRDTSPLPEDDRLFLPPPSNRPKPRPVTVIESTCPRCGAVCESSEVTFECGCGQIHDRVWPQSRGRE